MLYDKTGEEFEKPRILSSKEQLELSQRYFNTWFERGRAHLAGAKYYVKEKFIKEAVFLLHQSAEAFYNTVLLVFTGCKPKTHNLEKLRQYAKPYSKELMQVFPDPTEDQTEFHLFDLLKRGYIDARYKEDYMITEEELSVLIEKVDKMRLVVEKLSTEHLNLL